MNTANTANAERAAQSPLYEAPPPARYAGERLSLDDFLRWEAEPDGWKYEWKNGIVIAEEESMKTNEIFVKSASPASL